MKTSRIVLGIISAVAIAGTATAAWAGFKRVQQVHVDVGGHQADGSLGAVRNSSDGFQDIGCGADIGVFGQTNPTTVHAACYATDANRVKAFCTTTSPELVKAIRSITESSMILFNWNDQGICYRVMVDNYSGDEPKK